MKHALRVIVVLAAGVFYCPWTAWPYPTMATLVGTTSTCGGLTANDSKEGRGFSESTLSPPGCPYEEEGRIKIAHVFASAQAFPLGSAGFDVGGAAQTRNGAGGIFQADSWDLVTLHSPLINYTGAVTVVVGTRYEIRIGFGEGLNPVAAGEVNLEVPVINGVDLLFPPNATHEESTPGLFTGQISDEFTILTCPCSFVFRATARGVASGGGSVDVNDPFFAQLPPGWTYTLSSAESTVPEPGTLIPVGLGLFVLGVRRWRWRSRASR